MEKAYLSLCDAFEGDRRKNLALALMKQHHWQLHQANDVIDEYIMFLYIASQNVDVPLIPTREIDCAWEADILQSTSQYMQTCQALCGQIIHHAGAAEMQKNHTLTKTKTAFAKTLALFSQYFDKTRLSGGLLPAACGVL